MFELSCLSGVQSALESIQYAEDGNVVTDLMVDKALEKGTSPAKYYYKYHTSKK